ncbi:MULTISPECIES: hypothetical protein [Mycetocola]|uniref:hypothetical protein n=1 Tax=Mycetocola TaxID=76634 RepID=UPI0004C0B89B|nr:MULTISPECIES: hypothetical protein [Mycetocola]MCS4274980.1 hypothetical protein [Mycetocola sp. BIGb0189]
MTSAENPQNFTPEPGFEEFAAADSPAFEIVADAEPELEVSGVLPPLFVAEYLYSEDLEATLAAHRPEEGVLPTGAERIPGWFFQVTANETVLSEDAEVSFGDDVEYVVVFNGADEAGLPGAVAQVIQALIDQVGPRATEFIAHSIGGSVQEFDAQFAGAFDLRVGAPELLTD